jgi:hypothetical protein
VGVGIGAAVGGDCCRMFVYGVTSNNVSTHANNNKTFSASLSDRTGRNTGVGPWARRSVWHL